MIDNFHFDDDEDKASRSTRKSASRRRKDPVDDDNLDAVLDSVMASSNKPIPQPRKSSKNREDSFLDNDSENNNNNYSSKATVSGWGDENFDNQPTRSNRRRDQLSSKEYESGMDFNPLSKSRTRNININQDNEGEIEIPEIPEMEEQTEQNEDIAFKVAEAPDVQVHQISTYKELDKEFFKEKAFQFLEGNIDVSLLHCGLNTEQQVSEEDDVVWEWSKLFTEVVSILTVNKEAEGNEQDILGVGDEDITKSKSDTLPFQQQSRRGREINF